MKILHYFLGFPPYRSGGLTKYCCDLMGAQVQRGDSVIALWPGAIRFLSSDVSIRNHGFVDKIASYELINPLPVPLDEGITNIPAFTAGCDISVFSNFLKELQPEVIHIHTLMGLYREFILAANLLGIRTVFTTHDYFGLCPKVTMYRDNAACLSGAECTHCPECNRGALSLTSIKLLQSPVYRRLKDSFLVQQLRKRHRQDFFTEDETEHCPPQALASQPQDYRDLREFYIDILSRIDRIHFNSTVAQQVYTRYFTPKSSMCISITHSSIQDRRQQPTLPSDKLRLTYLAPAKPFKGYLVMKQALDKLWNSGKQDFVLNVFGTVSNPSAYMHITEGGFQHNQLPGIFANTDVLLAPSVWYETFGFTVLEALSFGVPVIITQNVGAKDVVGDGGIVITPGDPEELAQAVCSLTKDVLAQLRHNVQTHCRIKTWSEFLSENDALYQ